MSLRFSTALIAGAVLAASTCAHPASPVAKKATHGVATTGASPNQIHARSTPIQTKPPVRISDDDASIPTSTLAFLEAAFHYCETIDSKSAPHYVQLLNVILTGSPVSEIKAEESTPDYAAALAGFNARLKSAPVSSGLSICRSAMP